MHILTWWQSIESTDEKPVRCSLFFKIWFLDQLCQNQFEYFVKNVVPDPSPQSDESECCNELWRPSF